jgi:hypothetical protein
MVPAQVSPAKSRSGGLRSGHRSGSRCALSGALDTMVNATPVGPSGESKTCRVRRFRRGKGATVRITFRDARRGSRELDVTDAEAEKLGGRQVARRGRRPKATS